MIKKNNKGFTLIEVIAVVALIGILSVFAVPRIYDLLTNSRNRVYVEDAIRLIAQARYSMNAKSVKIEKPDNGECIVFSMKYLSSGDFQNPPNGGSYLTESSFVVVKNIGGDYSYSTMLVEKTAKGQFIGVELSTENALNAKDAIKHVRTFSVSELGYIDEDASIDAGGKFVNSSFINSNLQTITNDGNWSLSDDKIIGYYNNEIDDPDVVTDTSSPKVTAKFSTSGSLQTVLSVYATDSDNVTSELRVFVKISHSDSDTYPNPSVDAGESYGNEGFYSKEIDFGNYGFSYDNPETAYVYILVADPNNNYTRKRMTYDIHENEPPAIKLFSIGQLTNNNKNMPQVRVNLQATDDMDQMEDLFVCFAQDKRPDTCSPYKKYSTLFGNTGSYTYNFTKTNGDDIVVPDGSSHTLTVYVKDSLGLVTNQESTYQLYNNTGPNIVLGNFGTSCAFMRDGVCQCRGASCNSLTAVVNLNITDDITDPDDVRLKIYHKVEGDDTAKGVVETTFGQFRNGDQKYTFSGEYDGKARTIYIEATDEYGVTTKDEKVFTGVYSDDEPKIYVPTGRQFITTAEDPCDGTSNCKGKNSYSVNLNFTVEDDITSTGDLKVCVSEKKSDCESDKIDSSTFVKYSEFDRTFEFSHDDITDGKLYPNPAITKKLYAAVVDSKNHYVGYNKLNPIEYTLYNNHKPNFTGSFTIASTQNDNNLNLRTVKIDTSSLDVLDDFEKYTVSFCYYINSGDDICTPFENFNGLKNRLASHFEYTDSEGNPVKYTGQEYKNYFVVQDNYEATDKSTEFSYRLYADRDPEIKSFGVKQVNANYSSNNFEASFEVNDLEDTFKVCVTAVGNTKGHNCDSDENYVSNVNGIPFDGDSGDKYTIEVDGEDLFGWDKDYKEPREQLTKTIKLYVKDSNGNISEKSTTYTLYKLCDTTNLSVVDDSAPFEFNPNSESGTSTKISAAACEGKCYRDYFIGNTNPVIYSTRGANTIIGNYTKQITYNDNLVNKTCEKPYDTEFGCEYVDCFDTGDEDTVNTNVVGLKLIDEGKTWYYSNDKVQRNVLIDKPYCENPGNNAYFYNGDSRCEKVDETCNVKIGTYCAPIIEAEAAEAEAEFQEIYRQYEVDEAAYQEELLQALADYLLVKFPSEEEMISTCIPHENEVNNASNIIYCGSEKACQICKNHMNEEPYESECFDFWEADSCDIYKIDSDDQELCDLITTCQDFTDLTEDAKETFYDTYYDNHPRLKEPMYITQDMYDKKMSEAEYGEDPFMYNIVYIKYDYDGNLDLCKKEHMSDCTSKYSFCNETSITTYKESVSCSENPDITPIYCRNSDFYDGYCLENDTTCDESDDDCQKVCYKEYNCQDEYEERPVVFTCNGYFKTYESKKVGESMTLQETPIRMCPEFFMYYFPDYYNFDQTKKNPYIRFDPSEIG